MGRLVPKTTVVIVKIECQQKKNKTFPSKWISVTFFAKQNFAHKTTTNNGKNIFNTTRNATNQTDKVWFGGKSDLKDDNYVFNEVIYLDFECFI
jgi:phage pi2 protein 07